MQFYITKIRHSKKSDKKKLYLGYKYLESYKNGICSLNKIYIDINLFAVKYRSYVLGSEAVLLLCVGG